MTRMRQISTFSMWTMGWVSLGLLLVMTAASVAAPTPKPDEIVTLKDGTVLRGQVTKIGETLQVRSRGVRKIVPLKDVKSRVKAPSAIDEYFAKKAKANLRSADSLTELANWIWENHRKNPTMLAEGKADLQAALKINPKHIAAQLKLERFEAQIKSVGTGSTGSDVIDPKLPADPKLLVSQRDIYWIRLRELRKEYRLLTIKYENKVQKRYIDSMRGKSVDNWDRRSKSDIFKKWPRALQVMEMIDNRENDVELLKDIYVVSEPTAFRDFKNHIWPIVRRNCAQSKCHGGAKPKGGLRFFTHRDTSKEVLYTNFVIMDGYVGKKKQRLIDRQEPMDSLILQYALNHDVAKVLHSKKIPAKFTGVTDKNFKRTLKWIKSLSGPMHPDYELKYKAPRGLKLDLNHSPNLPGLEDDDEKKPAPSK